jgi:hypothetical protein
MPTYSAANIGGFASPERNPEPQLPSVLMGGHDHCRSGEEGKERDKHPSVPNGHEVMQTDLRLEQVDGIRLMEESRRRSRIVGLRCVGLSQPPGAGRQ